MTRPAPGTRLFRFLVVGLGAAGLMFVLSFLLVSTGLPPFPASAIAYAIAFIFAYSAQSSWTFAGPHDHGHTLPRYVALQAGCAVFSGLASHVAVAWLGMSPLAMSAVTTAMASAVSFVLSSVWVFSERG